jgi:hypothetical protein
MTPWGGPCGHLHDRAEVQRDAEAHQGRVDEGEGQLVANRDRTEQEGTMAKVIICEMDLVGKSPLGFNAPLRSEKEEGESPDDHDERCWRERLHVDGEGIVYIPAMALKHSLVSASKYVGEKVKGRGQKQWTTFITAGLIVNDNISLGIRAEDVEHKEVFVPSTGVVGAGKRVWKRFPMIPEWHGRAEISIVDPSIKPDRLERYGQLAGLYVGLLWWRVEKNGQWGRFTVKEFEAVQM